MKSRSTTDPSLVIDALKSSDVTGRRRAFGRGRESLSTTNDAGSVSRWGHHQDARTAFKRDAGINFSAADPPLIHHSARRCFDGKLVRAAYAAARLARGVRR